MPLPRYYTGFIASCGYIAQFLSSFLWGRLSDWIGRKPVLIMGAIGNMNRLSQDSYFSHFYALGSIISSILFGFSWSLYTAIAFRSINGLLNGMR